MEILKITDDAKKKLIELCDKDNNYKIRAKVIGGGCSGLAYDLNFSEEKEKDNKIVLDSITILIDPKSTIYLKDSILDFIDGINGKGFIFRNPNAKNTCGCGESFSI